MFAPLRRLRCTIPTPPKPDGGFVPISGDNQQANHTPQVVDESKRRNQLQKTARTTAALPLIPDYEMLGILGEGGMGIVYKARHRSLKRFVALKMIAAEQVAPSARRRFQTEAETIARLHHPSIVQIFDIGEYQGRPFLALELVEGGSLANLLATGPLPVPQAIHLTAQMARAMHYAHTKGVIHRDLKPANILLESRNAECGMRNDPSLQAFRIPHSEFRIPKITDFGLAKFLDEDQNRTRNGMILGTPAYMAPEQALGNSKAIGPQADVYALGTILYEMLTGKPPFTGKNSWAVLSRVVREEPLPPSQRRPRLARDLDTICLKALAKEPHRRYANAGELVKDLERFATGEQIEARPEGHWERLGRRVRQYPLTVAAIALFFGAIVLAGSYFEQQCSEARLALNQGRQLCQDGNYGAALVRLKQGQDQLRNLPAVGDLRQQLDDVFNTAKRKDIAVELHAFADEMRYRYADPDFLTLEQINVIVQQCRQIWEARTLLFRFDDASDPAWTEKVVLDLYDLASLGSALEQRVTLVAADQCIGQDAPGRLLRELEQQHVHAPVLAQIRRYIAQRSGQAAPKTAWDHYVLGRSLRQDHRLPEAAAQFARAIQLDENVAYFYFEAGHCALQQQRYLEAHYSLTTCIAIAHWGQTGKAVARPDAGRKATLAACYSNRALAEIGLGQWQQAEADLSRALTLRPELASVWFFRGIVNRQRHELRAAEADLQRALDLKAPTAKVHYQLALTHREAGEWDQVQREIEEARKHADCPSEIAALEQELQQRQRKVSLHARN